MGCYTETCELCPDNDGVRRSDDGRPTVACGSRRDAYENGDDIYECVNATYGNGGDFGSMHSRAGSMHSRIKSVHIRASIFYRRRRI